MYSPLNSYAYIHWILDFKYILLLLLWEASVKGSITKISFDNKLLCGLILKGIKMTVLIINDCMPCDKNYAADEYIDVLNVISQI